MDRFKFRIWDIKKNKYRQGTANLADTCLDCLLGKVIYGEGMEIYGEEDEKDVILEQCTGLKDKNGKLIYEGDIVKSIFSDEKLYEVIWCADCYKLRVFTKSSRKTLEYLGLKNTRTSYEVIGNIHTGEINDNKK